MPVFPRNEVYKRVLTRLATLVIVRRFAICPHDDAVTRFLLSAIHKFTAISSAVPWLLVEDSNSKALVDETVTLAL